ncbi:MAG: type III-B CRISPR module RAMP protein Cmr4 [Anaerolineae bacterium]|nr:type III-B CRISPR module RAMP protein Cmr4 [Anaerolineae bacterium]
MAIYRKQRYLLMATDPIHVGTGGYRLGRVDLSIVREPGTRVPKIPGTSLSGAIRSYAAYRYGSRNCAGQKGHCGSLTCPICYTFGSIKEEGASAGDQTKAFSGVVNIFDAQVLLFPVHSMAGPVWVSTPGRLEDAGFQVGGLPQSWTGNQCLFSWPRPDALNLGWLMLQPGGQVTINAPDAWKDEKPWQSIREHIVLVQEALFSQVVNSNLEVRTSVSIDPERGAAEDGALFTYEALPRATFLFGEVVLDDYWAKFPADQEKVNALGWMSALDVVKAGLSLMAWLGVGGMGTRGFGRLALVGEPVEE